MVAFTLRNRHPHRRASPPGIACTTKSIPNRNAGTVEWSWLWHSKRKASSMLGKQSAQQRNSQAAGPSYSMSCKGRGHAFLLRRFTRGASFARVRTFAIEGLKPHQRSSVDTTVVSVARRDRVVGKGQTRTGTLHDKHRTNEAQLFWNFKLKGVMQPGKGEGYGYSRWCFSLPFVFVFCRLDRVRRKTLEVVNEPRPPKRLKRKLFRWPCRGCAPRGLLKRERAWALEAATRKHNSSDREWVFFCVVPGRIQERTDILGHPKKCLPG